MIYYRVKKEFDNKRKLHKNETKTRYHYKFDIWIKYELYTGCELDRMKKNGIIINTDMFEQIKIPKNKTYWFFGARFELNS